MQQEGDAPEAVKKYRQAARVKLELGAVPEAARAADVADEKASSPQAVRLAELLAERESQCSHHAPNGPPAPEAGQYTNQLLHSAGL
jgi:hypothetical protein